MKLLVVLLEEVLLYFAVVSSQGELVQVPQNATVVPGENATFHCDIVPASDDTVWRLQNENSSSLMSTIITKTFINRNVKSNAFNISAREVGNVYSSTLTIIGDAESNFTRVQCIQLPAEIGNLESHFTNITVAFLRVIAPPMPATDFHVSSPSDKIMLSWSPSFSPFSDPVTYHITIESFNDHLYSNDTRSTSLQYSPPNGFCSILNFTLSASNRAGSSDVLMHTSNIFAEPNVQGIDESLRHQLQLENGEIVCNMEFKAVVGCSAHPVLHYFLLLQDDVYTDENQTMLGPAIEPKFAFNTSDVIRENTRYIYKVRAVNDINISSESQGGIFYTTDLQSSKVTIRPDSVLLRCNFLLGSQCRGCYVSLVFGEDTVPLSIARIYGEEFVEYRYSFGDRRNLDDVFVFDWEADGSIGSVSIPVEKVIDTSEGLEPGTDEIAVPVISASVAVFVLVVVLLMVVTCCGLIAMKRKRKGIEACGGTESPQLHAQACRYNTTLPYGPQSTELTSRHSPTQQGNEIVEESLYSQIAELNIPDGEGPPLYSQLDHFSSQQVSPVAVDTTEELYSQLGQDREYAVLEHLPSSSGALEPSQYSEVVPYHSVLRTCSSGNGSVTNV